ncbi:MAG: AAA family ATPase [Tenuifilum sp.]|uniref:ATP-binding protein n=1 Tax=Tenuifilum sp. TaxID=2760880 RepID=UPI0030A86AC2
MEQLNIIYHELTDKVKTGFTRYLLPKINWNARLIAITGPRGVGKTTLMLQKIKIENKIDESLYVSLDNIYFSNHTLFELAGYFYRYGGRHLFIDEVHKYETWSQEIKNIYDSFPDLQIVFSGSSILDIYKGFGDLSRRVVPYHLNGLSFREYLIFETGQDTEAYSLDQILSQKVKIKLENPLIHFKKYLNHGYYPFYKDDDFMIRLTGTVNAVLEVDIPKYLDLKVSTIDKLKHLLQIISESVPFKPNYSKIADIIGVSRNLLPDYLAYLEKAGLILELTNETKGIRRLGKVNKVYLNNPNLAYMLSGEHANIGNIRETFFFNQLKLNHKVFSSETVDFKVEGNEFEIGGKSKGNKQISKLSNAYIVKDDIEYGFGNTIPLWHFGLLY